MKLRFKLIRPTVAQVDAALDRAVEQGLVETTTGPNGETLYKVSDKGKEMMRKMERMAELN